jgi:hypothetical protein
MELLLAAAHLKVRSQRLKGKDNHSYDISEHTHRTSHHAGELMCRPEKEVLAEQDKTERVAHTSTKHGYTSLITSTAAAKGCL